MRRLSSVFLRTPAPNAGTVSKPAHPATQPALSTEMKHTQMPLKTRPMTVIAIPLIAACVFNLSALAVLLRTVTNESITQLLVDFPIAAVPRGNNKLALELMPRVYSFMEQSKLSNRAHLQQISEYK